MIDVTSKIWRPKLENKYVPLDYDGNDIDNNIDNNLLVFTQYGKTVLYLPAVSELARADIHFCDCACDTPEFRKHIWIGTNVDFKTCGKIEIMVQKYWDVFCKAGVCVTVLGFELAIDTGGS